MPGLASGAYPDRSIFYSSYISTYIERDVKDISGGIDALKFNRFVTAVAARTSQLLNYNAVAEDADINIQTAKSWMNILETLGIIFLLHPYSTGAEPYLYYYRDRDAKEIDIVMEENGKLFPLEIKKTALPDKRLVRVFGVLDKSPLQIGTGAILCMAESFGAFDRNNLIIPVWMI